MLDNASYFGRVFARSGGLAVAVEEALKEHGITEDQFQLNAISCNGISECKAALLRAEQKRAAQQLHRGHGLRKRLHRWAPAASPTARKSRADVDKYGHEAMEKTIRDSIEILNF